MLFLPVLVCFFKAFMEVVTSFTTPFARLLVRMSGDLRVLNYPPPPLTPPAAVPIELLVAAQGRAGLRTTLDLAGAWGTPWSYDSKFIEATRPGFRSKSRISKTSDSFKAFRFLSDLRSTFFLWLYSRGFFLVKSLGDL